MLPGINASDISKLKAANIVTIAASPFLSPMPLDRLAILISEQTLVGTLSRKLLKIKGFSDTKVEKIKEAGKKLSVSTRDTHMIFMLTFLSRLLVS